MNLSSCSVSTELSTLSKERTHFNFEFLINQFLKTTMTNKLKNLYYEKEKSGELKSKQGEVSNYIFIFHYNKKVAL